MITTRNKINNFNNIKKNETPFNYSNSMCSNINTPSFNGVPSTHIDNFIRTKNSEELIINTSNPLLKAGLSPENIILKVKRNFDLNTNDIKVFLSLLYEWKYPDIITFKTKTIAEELDINKFTVEKSITKLSKLGFFEKTNETFCLSKKFFDLFSLEELDKYNKTNRHIITKAELIHTNTQSIKAIMRFEKLIGKLSKKEEIALTELISQQTAITESQIPVSKLKQELDMPKTIDNLLDKLFQQKLIKHQKVKGKNTSFFTYKFYNTTVDKKVLESGFLIFDKTEKIKEKLNSIPQKGFSIHDDGKKIKIKFDRDKLSNIDRLLREPDIISNPAVLIIPTYYRKNTVLPDGLKIIFADFEEEIKNNTIPAEIIKSYSLTHKDQLFLQELIGDNILTIKDAKQKKLFYKNSLFPVIKKLTDLNLIEKNKQSTANNCKDGFCLTEEFTKKLKDTKSTFDIEELKKEILSIQDKPES
jgi:predicted transcriptional regulator